MLVPETVQDDSKPPNIHAGPGPQILRIGRAERAEVPPNQRVLGLLLGRHQSWLAKPSIHPREGDLLSVARTEAHEPAHHGGADEVPRGVGSQGPPNPPALEPILFLPPPLLRPITDQLGAREPALLEGMQDH